MMYLALCALVLLLGYAFTIVTTSVGYHRGLAHGAVELRPGLKKALLAGGIWLTGIDATGWVVMHRLHHAHADTADDPHTPQRKGFLGFLQMFKTQLVGYDRVLAGLRANDPRYTKLAGDLKMSWVARTNRSWLPILAHVALAVAVGAAGGWLLGVALFAGMMSHVVQGALINFLGHAYGRRNFDTADDSRNNHVAAWLVLGEGFQNNHHRWPSSARFSYRPLEVDLGFAACLALERLGALTIRRGTLMPRAPHTALPQVARPRLSIDAAVRDDRVAPASSR